MIPYNVELIPGMAPVKRDTPSAKGTPADGAVPEREAHSAAAPKGAPEYVGLVWMLQALGDVHKEARRQGLLELADQVAALAESLIDHMRDAVATADNGAADPVPNPAFEGDM